MYNNSSTNNNCGCSYNYNNNYKAMPKNCNISCQCDEIAVQALNNMAQYLSHTNNVTLEFEKYKSTLNETNVLYKELGRVDVLYSRFDKSMELSVQGNYKYERALEQIIKAYNCCQANKGAASSECSTYINNAKKIQSDVLNLKNQMAVKLKELEDAIIKSGDASGNTAVAVFAFSEPLNLSFMSTEEEINYLEDSYMMKVDGYNCCKNNENVCGSCGCYDPKNPLCQCDEIMRQSQEVRMQAEREGLYSKEQQSVLQQQTRVLTEALKKDQENSNTVYKIMDEMINLQKNITSKTKQGIEEARRGYVCCSNTEECMTQTTYTYVKNKYKYNYNYNPYNTCKEECPIVCDTFVEEADRLIGLGNVLIGEASDLYVSLKVEIDSRIEIEAQSQQLYEEAVNGIEKSFESLDIITKNIYDNVLCKLDEAYLCCTKQY